MSFQLLFGLMLKGWKLRCRNPKPQLSPLPPHPSPPFTPSTGAVPLSLRAPRGHAPKGKVTQEKKEALKCNSESLLLKHTFPHEEIKRVVSVEAPRLAEDRPLGLSQAQKAVLWEGKKDKWSSTNTNKKHTQESSWGNSERTEAFEKCRTGQETLKVVLSVWSGAQGQGTAAKCPLFKSSFPSASEVRQMLFRVGSVQESWGRGLQGQHVEKDHERAQHRSSGLWSWTPTSSSRGDVRATRDSPAGSRGREETLAALNQEKLPFSRKLV